VSFDFKLRQVWPIVALAGLLAPLALQRAAMALAEARPELGRDAVLAAHHVREAVAALEELVGLIHPAYGCHPRCG